MSLSVDGICGCDRLSCQHTHASCCFLTAVVHLFSHAHMKQAHQRLAHCVEKVGGRLTDPLEA